MAEFVEKRCEDMIPELEHMESIKLFDKNEIRGIAKKLKENEYKLQRHTKTKEDYLRYIQYLMDLLKLIKQRRDKFGINQKKSNIDHIITNKMNNLYKEAIFKFQDDIRFWIAYIKFCKHVHFQSSVSHMLGRMLQVHQDKPKCWHIAARWELEENKNKQTARQFLLRGLHIHPTSQLLFTDAYRLELDEASSNNEKNETSSDPVVPAEDNMTIGLKRAYIIYQQASKCIKDIIFIVELLNIAKEHNNTEKLQNKIVSDMIQEYAHEPLMWDTMARRELEGLVQPSLSDTSMEIDSSEQTSLRDRITSCNKVYQTALKKIKTEEMWTFYIECLIEINQKAGSLPNFKRKLLKTAFAQAHQAKKLKEKYYLHWVNMLNVEQKNETTDKKIREILCMATEAIPSSVSLWHARLRYLLISGQEEEAETVFSKVTQVLGEKSLPLWKMKILHVQAKSPEKTEEIFQAALQGHPNIAQEIKPTYIEWLVLTKSIQAARKVYNNLCLQPPFSIEFHRKMTELELMQPELSLKYIRKCQEMSTLQFGKTSTSIWIDYIKFEMKHGDPKKVGDLHRRAVKTLEPGLTDSFISEYSLIKANPDSLNIDT
ncbi:PREDICTED: U3 small nucleolar RNA-associated protein 6 homolog [Dufourea novaeangliae]|uniref:U3 small nucleolar RNA-associated protein 6 like protein n=1 Tax=Dufourea novaeangliae TaxID=178035 RepID=A0A154P8Y7_DUFNO|nr:PREDICTED: U3 small nucleolar RNA-associated protein 6 homolog [Dufourea novaeangliae]KZC08369.1 U3 small nucleolar RNA-associated protein 6 like protein [Dufourea novaeangliae]